MDKLLNIAVPDDSFISPLDLLWLIPFTGLWLIMFIVIVGRLLNHLTSGGE